MKCRLCAGNTKQFLDLGKVPLPEEFRQKMDLSKKVSTFSLGLSYCLDCMHVQLSSVVPTKKIYNNKNYFYDYSVTKTGQKHWQELADSLSKKYSITNHDLVVDIGSNTGLLLSLFKNKGAIVQGVDPTAHIAKIAQKQGVPTIVDFFSVKVAREIVKKLGKAKIITCNNTFDHVSDLHEFMKGIQLLLQPEGVFIIEVPYFASMMQNLTHIAYHQQIDYMLLTPLITLLSNFGMEIIETQEISIHGGSIRISVAWKNSYKPSSNVKTLLQKEKTLLKNYSNKLKEFAKNVYKQRDDFRNFVLKLKSEGESIAGIGASAKGTTFINYCGLGKKEIDFITEKSSLKIGRYTPSGIPIVKDKKLFKNHSDHAIILAWNFAEELMQKLKKYKQRGGQFILPLTKTIVV